MIFSPSSRIRRKVEKNLELYSSPSFGYFLLIALSSAMATIGVVLDNTPIIIGAMVVAPLITPIFGFSLSLLILRSKRLLRTALMLLWSTLLAIVVSAGVSLSITFIQGAPILLSKRMLLNAQPHFLFFLIALFSGIAGAYAYSKKDQYASIAGIAISVALIPPLAVAGVASTAANADLFFSALTLYGLNLAGISFGSILTFIGLGFGKDIEPK
jgi:uncharacterized hydrophobic protein (TIGR00271 family)